MWRWMVMDRDLTRQVVTVLTFVLTVLVNALAVTLPLNGLTTAEISDRFPALVVPANYVFGIWSLIYLLLTAFTVHQALPSSRRDPLLRSLGYLPAVTGLLNAVWVVLWHYEVFALTVPVMVALLASLVLIHRRTARARTEGGAGRWLVALPFSVYLGWISIATIANVSQMLLWAGFEGGPLPEEAWAVIVLAAGTLLAVTVLLRAGDPVFGLVVIWAYVGIAVKQEPLAVAGTALAGALFIGALIVTSLLRGGAIGPRRPGRVALA